MFGERIEHLKHLADGMCILSEISRH